MQQLVVGSIVEGKVTGITKFGAFVDLGDGKTGMVHISEVAPTFVKEIRDFVKENDVVKVKVLSVSEDGKISLSVKQALDPAQQEKRPAKPREGQGRPGGGRKEGLKVPRSGGRERDWNHPPRESGSRDFEDMLSRFMARSDEKISDLKRNTDGKRGSFGGRRGGKQQG